jgi:hypothetical protein
MFLDLDKAKNANVKYLKIALSLLLSAFLFNPINQQMGLQKVDKVQLPDRK